MKISIVTECNNNTGFGHLARCISLFQAFEEQESSPEFIVNGDSRIENLLEGKRYQVFDWLEEKKRLFKLLGKSEVVIVDSYLADRDFFQHISESIRTPVYLDDNKRLDYPRGIVLNGGILAEGLGYPDRKDMTYLCGTQYIALRKPFWEISAKEIKKDAESVMITFGSGDTRGLTPKILRLLNDNYPGLRKNVIVGRTFRDIAQIEKIAGSNAALFYNPDADKIKEVMMSSDIAISAGGQTLYELARAGLPTLGICVSENQELNLKGFQEFGFLNFLGWYNQDELDRKIIEDIEKFLASSERQKSSSLGQRLVDGKGARRAAGRILSLV